MTAHATVDEVPTALHEKPLQFELDFDTKKFKTMLDAMGKTVDEFRLKVTEHDISTITSDSYNACVTEVFYKCDIPQLKDELVLGIDVSRWKKCLKFCDSDTFHTSISIKTDKNLGKIVTSKIIFEASDFKLTSSMYMIDPRTIRKSPDIKSLDLDAMARIKGKTLHKIIRAIEDIGIDAVTFEVDSKLSINASNMYFELPRIVVSGTAKCSYSTEYLAGILSMSAKSDVIFRFSSDYPLKVEYEVNEVSIRYMLAPRIENRSNNAIDL